MRHSVICAYSVSYVSFTLNELYIAINIINKVFIYKIGTRPIRIPNSFGNYFVKIA